MLKLETSFFFVFGSFVELEKAIKKIFIARSLSKKSSNDFL